MAQPCNYPIYRSHGFAGLRISQSISVTLQAQISLSLTRRALLLGTQTGLWFTPRPGGRGLSTDEITHVNLGLPRFDLHRQCERNADPGSGDLGDFCKRGLPSSALVRGMGMETLQECPAHQEHLWAES